MINSDPPTEWTVLLLQQLKNEMTLFTTINDKTD